MNFNDLYNCVKKKFDEHQEIFLEIDFLAVNIEDIYGSAFYILWQNSKITVEPFYYEDHNVCIKAPQRSLELLFTERQYLFHSYMNKEMIVNGCFGDVMQFQKVLSYITKDNTLLIQEEIISNMLLKQDIIQNDLGLIMEALHLMLTNSLIDMPEKFTINGVKKKNFRKLKCGDIFEFGNWNNNPIEWLVLKNTGEYLFVITKDIVQKLVFHNKNVKVSFGKSDIGIWLNTNFYYSAFNDNEKERIMMQNIGREKCKIAMLSKDDITAYSQYIKNCSSKWWTCTIKTSQNISKRYIVTEPGNVKYSLSEQTSKNIGIRPTICISLGQ